LCGILISLGALIGPAQALAVKHHPTGAYAKFADCPLSNPRTELCLVATTASGGETVGTKTIPISKPIVLQGGLYEVSEEHLELIAAEDGNTLSRTPEPVTGGLAGVIASKGLSSSLQARFNELIGKGSMGVTATTELAAPVSTIMLNLNNLIEGKGVAFTLPVKVKLNNLLLGSNCYIGSNAHPIELALTTGTTSPSPPNTPITGSVGQFEIEENFSIASTVGTTLVDNSFAAPEAVGCGGSLSSQIDPAIDADIGLPSAGGHNTAIMGDSVSEGVVAAIRASE
jgi:hypothetical protein